MTYAVDIGGTSTRIARGTHADHNLIRETQTPSEYNDLLRLIHDHTDDAEELSVSCPGPIRPDGTVSPTSAPSPNLDWNNKPLSHDLAKPREATVYLQRDLNCAALDALQRVDNFTMLYPGTGFGYATAHNGEVITGTQNTAGELATIPADNTVYDEALCLNTIANSQGAIEEALRSQSQAAKAYIERLARLTAPLITVTAPQTILIGGHLASYTALIDQCRDDLTELLPYTPEIRGTDATPLRGAFLLPDRDIQL